MLFSNELNSIIKNDVITQSHFLGCFAADQVPKLGKNTFIILNTDPKNEEGEHWVVFHKYSENKFEFFDSLGFSPFHYKFKNLPNFDYIIYNKQQYQSSFSNACGYYCLYYLFYKSRGYRLEDILLNFSTNLNSNDLYVKREIIYMYNL